MEKKEYYSGLIGLDYYLEMIKKIAKKLEFEENPLIAEVAHGFCGIELYKTLPKDITIGEALKEVEKLNAKVREIERKIEEIIEHILEIP